MYCTVIIGLVLAFDKAVEKWCVGQTADLVDLGPGVRMCVLRRCRFLRRTRAAVLVAGARRMAPWQAPAPPPFPVATTAAGKVAWAESAYGRRHVSQPWRCEPRVWSGVFAMSSAPVV